MQRKLLLLGAAALATAGLAGCGDHGNNPSGEAPPVSSTQALDTAGVLALAQKTSETSEPFAVNDEAFEFTDTSNTSAPIGVNGM